MRPKKHFAGYRNQMRSSMMTTAVCVTMCAAYAGEAFLLPYPLLVQGTHLMAALALGTMLYDAALLRTPWDITKVVDDLELDHLSAARTPNGSTVQPASRPYITPPSTATEAS